MEAKKYTLENGSTITSSFGLFHARSSVVVLFEVKIYGVT